MSKRAPRKVLSLIGVLALLTLSQVAAQEGESLPEGDRLFVWVGEGAAPGQHSAANPDSLYWLAGEGQLMPVMNVPAQTSRVIACGDAATSPDGRHFMFYMGRDVGTLYQISGTDAPQPILNEVQAMACVGNGTFQYSPDSARFAFIDYPSDFAARSSAAGFLRVGESASGALTQEFDDVAAFSLRDEGAAMVRFFYNNRREATEVAVINQVGDLEREVATFFAEDNCFYNSAAITSLDAEQLALVMGYRCTVGDGRTRWQLHLVNTAELVSTLVATDAQPGGFFPFARTNNLYVAPDGENVYFTVPDGLTAHTVAIATLDLASQAIGVPVPNEAIMPRLKTQTYAAENHPDVLSGDGRWLAYSRNNANNDASLGVLDLNEPILAPISIPAADRGDSIAEILFTPDGQGVLYVSGGREGGDNSAFLLDVATGRSLRLRRGHYEQGVMSPDGDAAALMNWVYYDSDREPYLSLVLLNFDSTRETTLFTGGTVNAEGELENQQFIYPLSWRRAS